jgi:hypothetical protein
MHARITIDEKELREFVAKQINFALGHRFRSTSADIKPEDVVFSNNEDGPLEAFVDLNAAKLTANIKPEGSH